MDRRRNRSRDKHSRSDTVTVTFFSLSGFIFLITQYFQVLRGFSPFATGARILPVALSIAVGSIVGGLLAPRIGTRAVVVSGLASFGTAMAWIASSIDTTTPYWTTIVAQMLLMGLGITRPANGAPRVHTEYVHSVPWVPSSRGAEAVSTSESILIRRLVCALRPRPTGRP